MYKTLTSRLGERTRAGLADRVLWSRELGIGRTLLAVSTWATLVATPSRLLLREPGAFAFGPLCSGPARASVFCVFGRGNVDLGRNFALLLLVAVASGWRPRITCIPHWWLSWSVFVASVTADGGDQAATLLTLFLIPVALTDPRIWHWESHTPPNESEVGARQVVAASGLLAVEFQVAVIYLHSSIAKFGVSAWARGTAAYYWLLDPRFGAVSPLHGVIGAVLSNGLGVAVATYGVLAVELALGFGWLIRGRPRRRLFAAGVGLHAVIAILMGLPSFGVAMSGALVLYLLANDGPGWPGLARPSSPPADGE